MVRNLLVRQAYRFYAAMLLIWGGWSLTWQLFSLDMAAGTVGSGWLVIAGLGIPITAGLYVSRATLFEVPTRNIDRFKANSFSGAPLLAYAAALIVWSAVFAAWATGAIQLSAAIVGYGWLAIASYGSILTLGLVSTHWTEVLSAIGIQTPENEHT